MADFRAGARPPGPLASRCRRPFLVPDVSGDVVGEIGHADFHSRSGDADGSHEQAHPGFLVSEDVLDAGSDS